MRLPVIKLNRGDECRVHDISGPTRTDTGLVSEELTVRVTLDANSGRKWMKSYMESPPKPGRFYIRWKGGEVWRFKAYIVSCWGQKGKKGSELYCTVRLLIDGQMVIV